MVAAPGKIERPAQDKVKTDQRDAERVLRLLMIDALYPVRVPIVEEEALRDLMRARQRLSKLLLRHDILYEDTASTWTQRHRAWLRSQDLVLIDRPSRGSVLLPLAAPHTGREELVSSWPSRGKLPWLSPGRWSRPTEDDL
ncbi:MAG: hypothetical protein ABSG43_22390 [Solirubrobacteraceae bacterium]